MTHLNAHTRRWGSSAVSRLGNCQHTLKFVVCQGNAKQLPASFITASEGKRSIRSKPPITGNSLFAF
jgi:hypothetical protein